jgi:hypothetical protein
VEPTSVLYCNTIKKYKRKYGATSSVTMETSKQSIVAPWKTMQQSNCNSCPIY